VLRGTGEQDQDEWGDGEEPETFQLVRPYTLTRGRTRHAEGAAFDVIAQVVATEWTGAPARDRSREGGPEQPEGAEGPDGMDGADAPEYQQILDLVREGPLSVAEIAVETDLLLGVVRILLGDLLEAELISVSRPVPLAQLPDVRVLREVIQGLRAL
jgi:hypothetical protein